jgi:hypothetical protein
MGSHVLAAAVSLGVCLAAPAGTGGATPGVLTIEGRTQCPRPDDVAARLAVLAPDAPAARALLSDDGGALWVRLLRPDGTVVGERHFERGYGCSELAAATALVLASWQGELVSAPAALEAVMALSVVAPTDPARPAPAPRRRWTFELGAGFTSGWSLLPGVVLVAGAAPPDSGLGLELAAGVSAFHGEAIEPGRLRWLRAPLTLVGRQRWSLAGSLALEVQGGVAGALLLMRGEGFEHNHDAAHLDYGPIAGARLARRWGRVSPWVGGWAVWWSMEREASASPGGVRQTLPRFEAWAGLGATWRLGGDRLQGSGR